MTNYYEFMCSCAIQILINQQVTPKGYLLSIYNNRSCPWVIISFSRNRVIVTYNPFMLVSSIFATDHTSTSIPKELIKVHNWIHRISEYQKNHLIHLITKFFLVRYFNGQHSYMTFLKTNLDYLIQTYFIFIGTDLKMEYSVVVVYNMV